MTSRECRDYLDHLQHFGIKLGLENITTLLGALGDPHRRFPSVHVAGTNGKGSVSAMLERALREHGLRTGIYTSPHLVRVEERIRISGEEISAARFAALLSRIRTTVDRLMAEGKLIYHPTFFEVLTALAFLQFAERKVDIAVLEVGMGGRFDATNVIEPLVSVITTISMDHENHLGRTPRAIAFEKAGIIKPGVPVVCGVRGREALDEIRQRAKERGAPLVEAFGRGRSLTGERSSGGFRFVYRTPEAEYRYRPGLTGRYQGDNAAVAIAAAEVLSKTWRPLKRSLVLRGVREARWEGRLETVSRIPLVILDGAHNEEGVRSLADHIRGVLGRKVILVFAAMKDKDLRTMTRILFPRASTVILTQVPQKRSALTGEIRAAAETSAPQGPASASLRGGIREEPDVARAVRQALALSAGRIPVVIAGSLFLVGEVKRLRLFT